MKTDYPIVGGHSHLLPTKEQIPKSIRDKGYFDIVEKDDKQFMAQPFIKWQRPISHPTFFLKPHLEWMEENNIVHTGLLTLSQMYGNGLKRDDLLELHKFQNDFHAQLQADYPTKFSCGFVVNPLFIDDALKEIERRVKEGLKFLCLPTHYQDFDGGFLTCTDEKCLRIFELCNELNLPIQFHPYDYEKMMVKMKNLDEKGGGHVWAMLSLTAHFHYVLTSLELHLKFPNLRFNLSHGNSIASLCMGRKNQWFDGRPDLFVGCEQYPEEALLASNIFCDSIVHDPRVIGFLKMMTGLLRMFFGMDAPYPLGDGMAYVKSRVRKYATYTLDTAEDMGYITAEEKRRILQDTFFVLLYGNDMAKIQAEKKLIGI